MDDREARRRAVDVHVVRYQPVRSAEALRREAEMERLNELLRLKRTPLVPPVILEYLAANDFTPVRVRSVREARAPRWRPSLVAPAGIEPAFHP